MKNNACLRLMSNKNVFETIKVLRLTPHFCKKTACYMCIEVEDYMYNVYYMGDDAFKINAKSLILLR